MLSDTGIDIFQGETLNKSFIYSHETPLDTVVEVITVTFMKAVPTVDVLTASNNDAEIIV